jgi:hypothetical protein
MVWIDDKISGSESLDFADVFIGCLTRLAS